MIEVREAKYQEGYKIWLSFNTGESGVVDLTYLLHKYKAAAPLDKKEFQKFYLDEWPTLAWPCGFDLAQPGSGWWKTPGSACETAFWKFRSCGLSRPSWSGGHSTVSRRGNSRQPQNWCLLHCYANHGVA